MRAGARRAAAARTAAAQRRTVLYAVTDAVTATSLLSGQLGFLAAQGFEVHLACSTSAELAGFAAREGARVHEVPLSRGWWRSSDFAGLVRAIRTLREVRPDVLNYSTPKAALVWALASWFARPPQVVFLVRGLRLEGERPWRPGFLVLWLMELIAARSAHVTVCVSRGLRARVLALRISSGKSTVVLGEGSSNGVDSRRFAPISAHERQQAREGLGLDERTPVVGFVGRLTRDKGVEDLLDALEICARTSDVHCVLVGVPEPPFDLATAMASRPGASSRIVVRPPTRAVEREYAAFDALVLPSHREGLSNALLEAQSRGLPCITTDATGCADAIEPGVTGVVVPARDPARLAAVIQQLVGPGDRSRAGEMGAAGRRRVQQLFEPEAVWRRFADLYGADGLADHLVVRAEREA